MIHRLRKNFILTAMASVIFVLAVLMGLINLLNYVEKDRKAAEVLEVLMENGGMFPEEEKHVEKPEEKGAREENGDVPGMLGERPGPRLKLSAEAPYETRYFVVVLNPDGSLVYTDTRKIAAVSAREAADMARKLQSEGKISGYLGTYKYLAQQGESGIKYVFLDCTRDLNSVREFLRNSLLISLFGIGAIFLLIVFLSGRVLRPVAESYEKQKIFITNAGHEIKTPLTIINSCVDVLELEQGDNKWIQGIRGQTGRLETLTRELVSLAKMEEASAKLPMEEFSLSEAVRETLEPFALMAQNQNLEFVLNIQPDIIRRGNECALRQLCSILADNAVKYASGEGVICFSLFRKGRRILLVSENPAEGLVRGSQNRIFDRFYRGDSSRSSERPGYGIGLSMAQSIVAAHGGKIEAKSPDGKRMVITVFL
ncbi:MAG: HAMP domain-containing sensor histidine kinase [Candidatus Limivivens sp.]|nr:HAMP domain-containing sensor histidine kinase [Candidatus Limivivens sp.]